MVGGTSFVHVCACILAAGRQGYPPRPGSALPRFRRGRCWHRPGNLAMPQGPRRRAKSPALQSRRERAATHKRQPSARPAGGPMQASAPTQRCGGLPPPGSIAPCTLHCRAGVHARREGSRRAGKVLARQGAAPLSRLTPTLPVCGARIALRVLKHTCVLRPLRCREAAKTGAVSEGRSYAFYRRTGDNERSDGRLPYEKQRSPPQAALDSAAPCRGAFQTAVPPKPPQ